MKLSGGQALRIKLAGLACGIAAALGLTHLIAGLLYGVAPTDPVTFAAIAALLAAVMLRSAAPAGERANERVTPRLLAQQEAHFNLARLFERQGKRAAAICHLKAHRNLTRE